MSELQTIDASVYVSPSAQIYGQVSVAAESSIWPNVVIRAEAMEVEIGRYSNLQDFVMVHVGYEHATRVGDFCSITHHATIHGGSIEDDCLIGINAVVMDGAVIGRGSIVAGGAMVKEGDVVGVGVLKRSGLHHVAPPPGGGQEPRALRRAATWPAW